jgi:hypothetical protein
MKSIPSFLFRGVSEISKNKLAADQFLFQFTTLIYRDLFFLFFILKPIPF